MHECRRDECRINVECMNDPMTKGASVNERPYDLEERTAKFGENVIAFAKRVPMHDITRPLITQLVRAGTSIGANYCEADDAESKKDFRHQIGTCKKESRETKHWFRMIVSAEPSMRDEARVLWQEARELNLIFAKIRTSTGRR